MTSRDPWTLRRGLTFWRRSIQARVVVSTVILSIFIVSAVGLLLLQQTRDGLLRQRVDAVVAEAANETADARTRLAGIPGTDADARSQRLTVVDPIKQRGEVRGFYVLMVGPVADNPTSATPRGQIYSPELVPTSVPFALSSQFSETGAETAWTYAEIATVGSGGRINRVPGIVVGSQISLPADSDTYTLYYLFPLGEERETLTLVTRAMLTAAALLVALVAGLTWLVTRQVVTPIRLARRTAERLAAGQLQERVKVTGEDDLARLGMSFNQMASSLQRQIRQLEELSRVQRRFVSDVSHELRTPLTTVRMASDVLHDARADFDAPTARAAELLQTELNRFEHLLIDLLEISRFDAGAAVLESADVDLVQVCRDVIDMIQPVATRRGTVIRLRADEDPCLAQADPRRIERIIRNLVANAIDHAEGRDVIVRVNGDADGVAVCVRDYGVGLGPGESTMVFSRFWRADPARARTTGGTGLGLAIALEDAQLHDGWLQAWGHPGQGAQFRLTLPRRAGIVLRGSPLPLVPADAPETVG